MGLIHEADSRSRRKPDGTPDRPEAGAGFTAGQSGRDLWLRLKSGRYLVIHDLVIHDAVVHLHA
jgi:hypothetical protein